MGSKTTIPPAPGPSQQELDLLQKQTQSLDFYMKGMEEQQAQNKQQGLLMKVSSGLYDPVMGANGELTDATLNPDKLKTLQDQYAQSSNLQSLAMDRYTKALNGELPVTQGTLIAKQHDFDLLKNQAAQQGITINGNSLEEAASTPQNSTAGNELTKRLNETYQLREDAERQGQLNQAVPGNPGAAPLGLTGGATSGYGAAAGGQAYAQIAQGYGAAAQPLQQYNALAYQGQIANAQLGAQQNALPYQILGTALGAGIGAYAGK